MNTANIEPHKIVGLALSGGFIRTTACIGAIEVLEENGIPIDIISGCSSGSAVAAAYAAGTMPQLKKRLIEGRRRDYFKVIIEPTIPRDGFLKGERNRKFFEEFVGDKNFSDLNKKTILMATDLVSLSEVVIKDGKVSEAIQACTAVPGIFVPIKKDGKVLIDGGNFNLIPSKVLYRIGADYVIAIFVSQSPNIITRFFSNLFRLKKGKEALCPPNKACKYNLNILQLIWRTFKLSATQIKNFYHHTYEYNILIKPKIDDVKRWHINSVEYCIEQGRKAASEVLPQIKKDLGL